MTMGAGDIYKVAHAVAAALAKRGPKRVSAGRKKMNLEADLRALLAEQAVIRVNEPMARHTSLRVGGPAQFWVEPWNERDLSRLLHYCHARSIPVTVVGRGTNLLVRDGGIPGVVVHLDNKNFSAVDVEGERLFAGCGARLKTAVALARKCELGGLEFLEGIPGSVGGALRMNAGAMGRQMFDVVEAIRYVNLEGEVFDGPATSVPVLYRSCPLFNDHVALAAILRGVRTSRSEIDEKLQVFSQRRWSTQPPQPSAGCIFKNPMTIPAGRLIDELGLKGAAVGGARVSNVHANFIVNEGGATAGDVLRLIEVVRSKARQERGVELVPEVLIVGKEQ
jgi:UDP-N-acetylenolpyruvoylglucosamine reductase